MSGKTSKTLVDRRVDIGLARTVAAVLASFQGVKSVDFGGVYKYRGGVKVHTPVSWPKGPMPVAVCDGENGKRRLLVQAQKPGAIRRLLENELAQQGVQVERVNAPL